MVFVFAGGFEQDGVRQHAESRAVLGQVLHERRGCEVRSLLALCLSELAGGVSLASLDTGPRFLG